MRRKGELSPQRERPISSCDRDRVRREATQQFESGGRVIIGACGLMSALPPKADITQTSPHVRYVP
jgi:hypothetical protein